MKEIRLTMDMLEELFSGKPIVDDRPYKKLEEEYWIKRTIKTLIEDESLVANLVEFTAGTWKLHGRSFTADDVGKLLKNKYQILEITKVDNATDSGYEEEYHDGSRWENDYNPEEAYWSVRHFSFSWIIDEFIDQNPELVKFNIEEEWVKKEK